MDECRAKFNSRCLAGPSVALIYNGVVSLLLIAMPEVIELPIELTRFQLPQAVQLRLQALLDRQDTGDELSQAERAEAAGLVELSEFLSLLRLRSTRVTGQA